MARAPNPRIEQARAMYLQGEKLKDIAHKLGAPEGTVRRWKSTYNWESSEEGERSEKKKNVQKKKASVREERVSKKEKVIAEEVKSVMENPELNDKQRLFCLHYIRCFNATKAYQKAYGCDYNSAAAVGYRLLENVGVREEINRPKQARYARELLSEHDIFQKYMDIAFSDMTDFVEFGREETQVMGAFGPVMVEDSETGEKVPVTKIVNTVRFRESSEVDGTLISEVKQGRDGASIKLPDKLKALEWLADHMNMATEEQKARVAAIKMRMGVAEEQEPEDDGFLKALKGTAAEDWKEPEDEETDV